jgi:hypothetical protein
MKLTRISPLTNRATTLDLDITPDQLDAWAQGMLIQQAFPHLTPAEREFIHTGYTAEDWVKMFPPEPTEE